MLVEAGLLENSPNLLVLFDKLFESAGIAAPWRTAAIAEVVAAGAADVLTAIDLFDEYSALSALFVAQPLHHQLLLLAAGAFVTELYASRAVCTVT